MESEDYEYENKNVDELGNKKSYFSWKWFIVAIIGIFAFVALILSIIAVAGNVTGLTVLSPKESVRKFSGSESRLPMKNEILSGVNNIVYASGSVSGNDIASVYFTDIKKNTNRTVRVINKGIAGTPVTENSNQNYLKIENDNAINFPSYVSGGKLKPAENLYIPSGHFVDFSIISNSDKATFIGASMWLPVLP
jgi:hypothetical protein